MTVNEPYRVAVRVRTSKRRNVAKCLMAGLMAEGLPVATEDEACLPRFPRVGRSRRSHAACTHKLCQGTAGILHVRRATSGDRKAAQLRGVRGLRDGVSPVSEYRHRSVDASGGVQHASRRHLAFGGRRSPRRRWARSDPVGMGRLSAFRQCSPQPHGWLTVAPMGLAPAGTRAILLRDTETRRLSTDGYPGPVCVLRGWVACLAQGLLGVFSSRSSHRLRKGQRSSACRPQESISMRSSVR